VATLSPYLSVPNLVSSGVSGCNPFSWQFLFCIGLGVGEYYYARGCLFRRVRWVSVLCWAVVIGNLLARAMYDLGRVDEAVHVAFLDWAHEVSGGDVEGVLRLTHFVAVAYLCAGLVQSQSALAGSAWVRPLVWCGQHSLEVFCLGVVLSEFGNVYFRAVDPNLVHQLAANLVGWAAMSALAYYLGIRRKRRAMDAVPAALPAPRMASVADRTRSAAA
jgi:hypothetical protein